MFPPMVSVAIILGKVLKLEILVGIVIAFVLFKLFFGGRNKSKPSASPRSTTKYFQNKCYVCEHYSATQGTPRTSNDFIKCPIGGRVKVGVGCGSFTPDITASCQHCWHRTPGEMVDHCSIHGKIRQWRNHCPDAINKDSN